MNELLNATTPRRKGHRAGSSAPLQHAPLTLERMRNSVAELVGEPAAAIGDNDDLIGRGVDSVGIMRLANTWRHSGVELKFAELIERPTLANWWTLASARLVEPPKIQEEVEVDEAAPFELAPMQQAYWIGGREGQVLGAVNAQYYVEFDGEGVQADRLERAIRALLARHAMLRARFLPEGRQQIMPESSWQEVKVHDLRELPEKAVTQELHSLRRSLSHRRMAVERGEVFDIHLSLLPGGTSRMHLNIEMLVSDARSFQIILEDLAQLYSQLDRSLPPIRYSFQRYMAEQAERRTDAYARAKAYWQERLADMPGGPLLPLATEPGRLAEQRVGRRFYWMPPEDQRSLAQRSREQGLTLPIVLATAFAEVIGAWSAEPRFLINMPLFDREELHPDMELLVGDFTNLIIVAVDVSDNLSFRDQAKRLQARLVEDAAHAEYSGLEVLRDLARTRPGNGMMAPVIFTSAIGMGDLFSENVRRCFGTPSWTTSQTPQVWLDHQVTERDGGLLFNWDVVEELFPEGVVDAMFEAYLRLLRWLADTDSSWAETVVPPLLPQAQAEVRATINAPQEAYPDRLLHSGFFERAVREPERIALAWNDDGRMSYGTLAQRALSITAVLLDRGVLPGDAVAITMGRGPDQIAAVLGVLAAGATFVPVGIDQPVCRRAQIYENARANVVLTRMAEAVSLEWPDAIEVLAVEKAEAVAALTNPLSGTAESLAYVIYTSGTTGVPKGVEMTHRAAMNTIQEVNQRFGLKADDRVLAVSALDFDLSVYDIFGLLSVGGAIVVVEDEIKREARRWVELTSRWGVTVWNSVPALLDMLLIAAESGGPVLNLRLALVSGDWVGLDLPGRLRAQCPGCRFVSLGGATEAAIWSNAFEVDQVDESWQSIPYGFPLRNQKFRVVDGRGRDCPDWIPGELWIGGKGLAEGYRGDPERTADLFVHQDGERWYRTGDLGRYWPKGTLEFLGRADLQVKIRGHRIELGEIEAALEAHPQVSRAIAIAARKTGDRIAAAIIAREGQVDEAALRVFAADRLPPYMVPDDILVVEEFPLSPNGKVDRKALGNLIAEAEVVYEDEQPRGRIETALAKQWSEFLGIQDVGCRQSFFALGGDSLMATRLLETIRKHFGVEISLRQLLLTPTVSELSVVIKEGAAEVEEGLI